MRGARGKGIRGGVAPAAGRGGTSVSALSFTLRECLRAHLVLPDLFEGLCVVQAVPLFPDVLVRERGCRWILGEAVEESGHLGVPVRSDEPVRDQGAQESEFARRRVEVRSRGARVGARSSRTRRIRGRAYKLHHG